MKRGCDCEWWKKYANYLFVGNDEAIMGWTHCPWCGKALAEEIKPCPFCGSHNTDVYLFDLARAFAGRCRECGASGSSSVSEDGAAEKWNRRA